MKLLFNKRAPEKVAFFIGIMGLIPIFANAQKVLFEESFEDGISGDAHPVWSWDIRDDVRKGMMVGENDIYEVVEGEKFLSHRKSLRLNFSGRNKFCNQCGGYSTEVTSLIDGRACAPVERNDYEPYVYNRTNYFSRWEVTGGNDQEVCFDVESKIDDSIYGQSSSLSEGDNIYVPYVCGESGDVGSNNNRKSDCNKAINYLDGSYDYDVGFGEQISRRFYLYISEDAEIPNNVLKLGYSHWKPYDKNVPYSSAITISVQRGMTMGLKMPNKRPVAFGANSSDAPRAVKGEWMYIEEVFTRETSESSNDAKYELYMGLADAGESLLTPVVVETDMSFGEFHDMSIAGNWQHYNDVSGYAYFDEILISDEYSGPVNRPDSP